MKKIKDIVQCLHSYYIDTEDIVNTLDKILDEDDRTFESMFELIKGIVEYYDNKIEGLQNDLEDANQIYIDLLETIEYHNV